MNIAARQILWKNSINPWIYNNGTNLMLKIPSAGYALTIGSCVKDSQSATVTIDWGDGGVDTYSSSSFSPSHTYASSGLFVLNISDDISSLNYKGSTDHRNIYMMLSFGTKLLTLQSKCFQSAGYDFSAAGQQSMDEYASAMKSMFNGHIVDAYFTSMGSYACDCFRCTDLHFVNMESITGSMFYAAGLATVQNLYFSNIADNGINGDYLVDWSAFMNGWIASPQAYYNSKSVTFYNKTCAQIKTMSYFPWLATDVSVPVYFHGSDGTIDKYGNPVQV